MKSQEENKKSFKKELGLGSLPTVDANVETCSDILQGEFSKVSGWQDLLSEEYYEDRVVSKGLKDVKFGISMANDYKDGAIKLETDKFIGRRGAVPNHQQPDPQDSSEYKGFEIATNPTEEISKYLGDPEGVTAEMLATACEGLKKELSTNIIVMHEHGDLADDEYVQVDIGQCYALWAPAPKSLRVGYVFSIRAWVYVKKKEEVVV